MTTRPPNASDVRKRLKAFADTKKARGLQHFFKTGPGEYGEGDRFLGVVVPDTRRVVREFRHLPLAETEKLLESPVHEERLAALLILVDQFAAGNSRLQREIYDIYLAHTRYVNNWDLVDLSAGHIVGRHLSDRSRRPLYRLARSELLWDRRIAIMSTFHFIRQHDFDDALRISQLLLRDEHDLVHKAVGWMIREVGNRDLARAESFLKVHCRSMPRTMLRYAIEKFPETKRQRYLKGTVP